MSPANDDRERQDDGSLKSVLRNEPPDVPLEIPRTDAHPVPVVRRRGKRRVLSRNADLAEPWSRYPRIQATRIMTDTIGMDR